MIKRILIALIAVFLLTATVAPARADDSADLPPYVTKLMEKAEAGSASAQNNLAILYMKGRYVEQSNALATKWFRKAAEQGDEPAAFALGQILMNSPGGMDEAYYWLVRAAKSGNPNYAAMRDRVSGSVSPGKAAAIRDSALGVAAKPATPAPTSAAASSDGMGDLPATMLHGPVHGSPILWLYVPSRAQQTITNNIGNGSRMVKVVKTMQDGLVIYAATVEKGDGSQEIVASDPSGHRIFQDDGGGGGSAGGGDPLTPEDFDYLKSIDISGDNYILKQASRTQRAILHYVINNPKITGPAKASAINAQLNKILSSAKSGN